MADIIRVPGSHHGGWYFSPIVPALCDGGGASTAIAVINKNAIVCT